MSFPRRAIGLATSVLLASVLPSAAAATCPDEAGADVLRDDLRAAEAAYTELDVDGFTRSVDAAAILLPCLEEPIGPDLAAWYHRVFGIRLYVARDGGRAAEALAAARILDPDHTFSEDLLPIGHPIRSRYEAVDPESGLTRRVAEPLSGQLLFDGIPGRERPSDRSTIVQLVDEAGEITATSYAFTTDPLPPYAAKAMPRRGPFKPNIPSLVVAGSATAVALGLYGGALASEAAFKRTGVDRDLEDLERLRRQTNGLVWSSVGVGAVALGGLIGTFAFGTF